MDFVKISEARANLKSLIVKVCDTKEPVTVVRKNGQESVIILSLSEYQSMTETLYLLGNIENANRLRESIKQKENV